MDIIEAIRSRRSTRGYKPDPVPKEVIEEILESAVHAPSAMNSQPWAITVVTGNVLDNIKRSIIEIMTSGAAPSPDIPHKPYEGVFRQRQKDLAAQIFGLMGIAWEDKEKRAQWTQRGFRFYDAPVAIILSMDSSVDESQATFALGTLSQNICLAALKYGLGTCIEDQGILYPSILRKSIGIRESMHIVMGIAIGYPDPDFSTNGLETTREPVESVATWHGFD